MILIDNLYHIFYLIKVSGDIEKNPGPKLNSSQKLSICHWNLTSIAAHNFVKVSLLIAYNSIHKYDVICLPETYLDSSTVLGDDSLEIPGYNLVRCDHSSNTKRGGVSVYYKSHLPLKVLNMKHLQECLNIEFSIGKKICRLISLYRSPSQNQEEFNTFLDNLESNLETESLSLSAKVFVDDTSLFSVVRDIAASTEELNNDLRYISKWAYQWKMMFNPDLT